MIVRFFDSGISNGASPINYLLAEKDSKGKVRHPQPVVLSGDPELTKFLIDSNPNKHKYTSGAIAFRDNEHPSPKEIAEVIKSLRDTFAPGLDQNSVNFLFVLHRDKGNDEIHFIGVRRELKTGKAFNMMPPGKASQELARNWQASWNHKLGYDQVVEDPLKAIFSDVDKKVATFMNPKSLISRRSNTRAKLSTVVSEKVRSGEFKNRNDILDFFKDNGLQISRTGKDYISVKGNDPKAKPIRLRGPIYSQDADYGKLLQQVDEDRQKHNKLTETEFWLLNVKIQRTVHDRLEYNKARYQKPRRVKSYVLPGQSKSQKVPKVRLGKNDLVRNVLDKIRQARENSTSNSGTSFDIEQKTSSKGVQNTIQVSSSNGKSQQRTNSQNATSGPSGGGNSLEASLISIDMQIAGITKQMNSAKTAAEGAKFFYQLKYLQQRRIEIQEKIAEQKRRELNSSKPKAPGFN